MVLFALLLQGTMKQTFKILFLIPVLLTAVFINAQSVNRGVGIKIKNEDATTREVTPYKGSYALVIGVSAYSNGWSELPGVEDDVEAVSKLLKRKGFDVQVSSSGGVREMVRYKIENFINNYGLSPENRLVIYFAGHGHTEKIGSREIGYIVMADAPLPKENFTLFQQRAIEMSEIESLARRMKSKHALFIFDSCFSGTLMRDKGPKSSNSITEAITEKTLRPIRQFITSGSADQIVPDKSIFRVMLEKALDGEADSNHDGFVTGSELGGYLEQKVSQSSRNSQIPQYSKIRDAGLDEGDFVFTVKDAPTEEVVEFNFEKDKECKNVKSINEKATAFIKQEQYGAALLELNRAVSTGAKCASTYAARAYVNSVKGNHKESLADFDRAIEINPTEPDIFGWRGGLQTKYLKDPKKGITDYTKAIDLCLKKIECYHLSSFYAGRGGAFDALEIYDRAIEDYSNAIEMAPKDADILSKRSTSYMHMSQFDLALSDLNKAISIDSNEASYYHNRSVVYFVKAKTRQSKEDLIKAFDDMTKAIELNPDSAESYAIRAMFYDEMGNDNKANLDRKKAEELRGGKKSSSDPMPN